jgi:hypothetical protein
VFLDYVSLVPRLRGVESPWKSRRFAEKGAALYMASMPGMRR